MESFLLCLLALIALCTSLSIIFFWHKNKNINSKLPPGTTGWPFIGETIKFASSGPENFIQKRMQKYSEEVFKTSLLGGKTVVFCGSSGNKFLFSNDKSLLTTWWPDSVAKPLHIPTSGDNSLKESTEKTRSFIEDILNPDALKNCIPVMDSMAREHLETNWAPFEEVKVYPRSKKFTFSLSCRLFLGKEDPELVKALSDSFNVAASGIISVPINFPGTTYNQAMKGGKIVKDEILKIIKDRKRELEENRNNLASGADFLTSMLLQTDENERFLNENAIANCMLSLLMASYETTSVAVTFLLSYLAEFPLVYDKVHQEIMEIAKSKAPEELLHWNDIRKMKYSWNVACETLRLVPPAPGAFREAVTDFTFAGFTIPKGWKTFWSVYSTHKNPKYFVNPEKFDPSRFEGHGPAPYTFIPFGGGPRACPGREYARLEILVFTYNVVRRFRLEKLIQHEKVKYLAAPIPQNGVPVRLLPHRK